MKILKILTLIIALSVLTIACGSSGGGGGGGGGAVALTESPSGAWYGTLHTNVGNQTDDITGTVSESNQVTFIDWDTGNQFSGTISGSGNQISCTVTGYAYSGTTFPDGSSVASIHIEGTITSNNTMTLTYSGGGDTGTISLSYDSAYYDRPSSLALVNDTWTIYGTAETITIDSNGNISGTFLGCTISGTISIINSSYNAYQVSVTLSNCGPDNGTYTGLASLWDFNAPNGALEVMVSNGTYSAYIDLTR